MKTTAVSFKSKIHIMTPKAFSRVPSGKYIYFFDDGKTRECIVKSTKFYTTGIKTCTGGGVQNGNEAVGFHLWDKLGVKSLKNKINKIKRSISNITSGLVIGSKQLKSAPNSVPNFEYILQSLQQECPNISYFRTFKNPSSFADFKYNLNNDTWYIRLTAGAKKDVTNIEKLKKFFKEIYIAPTDELLVDGQKVTVKDAPEFFC